jgi:uncharacterized protein Yka (UPF0111/DUF47 family)
MLKEKAVAALGQQSLLMPAWIKSALSANDRIKLYLSLLQSAAQYARQSEAPVADWGPDIAKAGLHDVGWLKDFVKTAYFEGHALVLPEMVQFLRVLASDLSIMARPICEVVQDSTLNLTARRDMWLQELRRMEDQEGLSSESLAALTRGNRDAGDSFHLLVMDLHKQLNALAGQIATEDLDGAHVWQLEDADRPRIQAFMRGLHRTGPLKFSHPGLDTVATRDGSRLLIQNDIGTNDVHVLVIEVEQQTISLTYSDLHAGRFAFFCEMLEEIGFAWNIHEPLTTSGLNAGKPYTVGTATLEADGQKLLDALEGVASRIVFVIDWNRARKRLQFFVSKAQAVAILRRSSQEEWGHMAWLLAGADRLVFNAMQAVDSDAFRVGDRLDEVLGEAAASGYLTSLLRISSTMLRQNQPVALIADEARVLLVRVLHRRTFEFDLLADHAAYCHALAGALCEALENGAAPASAEISQAVARAKSWERQADHQLMEARLRAERHTRWSPIVDLLEKSDDVADALEEAIFMHSLTLLAPLSGLPAPVNEALRRLAETTLAAIQDQVRAIEIARTVSEESDSTDSELFLQTLWRVLRAERLCDELSRQARMTIVRSLHDSAAGFQLATDLSNTIEKASDHLLAAGYALRQMVLAKTGLSA